MSDRVERFLKLDLTIDPLKRGFESDNQSKSEPETPLRKPFLAKLKTRIYYPSKTNLNTKQDLTKLKADKVVFRHFHASNAEMV